MASHQFRAVSGRALTDCCFIADRWSDVGGWAEDMAESWVGRCDGERIELLKGQVGHLTTLWRSPSNRLFVAQGGTIRTGVHQLQQGATGGWLFHELPFGASGVWGLHDEFVLAWGLTDSDPVTTTVMRWDGRSWTPFGSMPGNTMDLHGTSPDLVYAVGQGAGIHRWDGGAWISVPTPTQTMLSSVFVAAEDRTYACGTRGRLIQGSIYGWSELLIAPEALSSVVAWGREIWVGSATLGLHQLRGNVLDPLFPEIRPHQLEPRHHLLAACSDQLAGTADGKRFASVPIAAFVAAVKPVRPLWRRP
jgi:hypothetical protein